jgi:hypothetical protein
MSSPISAGFYGDGFYCYEVDSNGEVINVTSCSGTTTSTTTIPPDTELSIYAKYINSQSPGDLQYTLNGGSPVTIGPISTSSCLFLYTITGLTPGDSIVFSDTNTQSIAGSTSVCPSGPGGFGCNYSYSVLVSGPQDVYISVDGITSC